MAATAARSVEDVKREMNERRRLLAQLGSGRPEGKVNFVRGDRSKKTTITPVEEATTLYFHNDHDSEYVVEAKSVKLMVHECQRCVIRVTAPILTHCVEVWRCENVRIEFGVEVRTLQLDTSDGLAVHFDRKADMGTTVWTGVEDLEVSCGDDDTARLSTGFAKVQATDDTIEKEVSQFYIRIVEGRLTQEKVLRLKNGFPTTMRESNDYDREQAKAALAREAYVRSLVKFAERKIDIKDDRKAAPGGRNDPCHCGSGKKRKKCCGDWIKPPEIDPEIQTLRELQRSNAVDPAALIRRAREGDIDPRALPVENLDVGATVVRGCQAPPGGLVRVRIDGIPVGLVAANEHGEWVCEGIAPLKLGKIVEARIYDEQEEAAAAAADPLRDLRAPTKVSLFKGELQ